MNCSPYVVHDMTRGKFDCVDIFFSPTEKHSANVCEFFHTFPYDSLRNLFSFFYCTRGKNYSRLSEKASWWKASSLSKINFQFNLH